MRRNLIFWALAAIFVASHAHGAKMLAFFPFPGKSHHATYRVILTELAERGHSIDYYGPFPMSPEHPNIKYVKIKDITQDLIAALGDLKVDTPLVKLVHLNIMREVTLNEVCNMKEVHNLLKSDSPYDLVLHESHFIQEYIGLLAHRFQVPGVVLMSSGDFNAANELTGLPDNPSYVVDNKMTYGDRMNFFERLHNAFMTVASTASLYFELYRLQGKVDSCFQYPGWETRPPLPVLASDDALVLYNSHHSMGFSYPKPPHAKEIGGVNVVDPKPLPEELESFMSEAEHGVIYFSLGSVFDMTTMLGPEFKNIFANVFSRIEERVLWKWNGDAWPGLPSNVKISKWFPQIDVLAHKNVKLFITHGGLLSSYETIHFGVPTVIIPLFGDQLRNGQIMKNAGFGEPIRVDDITEENLFKTIRRVIDNAKYKQEATRRSELLRDRPSKPVKEAAYWIEYVMRHGRVLQPAAVHLSFVQFHLLDVYAFIAGCAILACFLLRNLWALSCGKVFSTRKIVTKAKKKLK